MDPKRHCRAATPRGAFGIHELLVSGEEVLRRFARPDGGPRRARARAGSRRCCCGSTESRCRNRRGRGCLSTCSSRIMPSSPARRSHRISSTSRDSNGAGSPTAKTLPRRMRSRSGSSTRCTSASSRRSSACRSRWEAGSCFFARCAQSPARGATAPTACGGSRNIAGSRHRSGWSLNSNTATTDSTARRPARTGADRLKRGPISFPTAGALHRRRRRGASTHRIQVEATPVSPIAETPDYAGGRHVAEWIGHSRP